MAWWKLLALGYKAQRGWKRLPPDLRAPTGCRTRPWTSPLLPDMT
jgi:hypothetical protein